MTEVGTSTGFDSVIVNATPFPSVVAAFAILNVALSLSMIVPVAEPLALEIVRLRPALLSPPNVAVNVSVPSTRESVVVLTVTVCEVTPAANVTV